MMVPVLVALLALPAPQPVQDTAPYGFSKLPVRILRDLGRLATPAPLITLAAGGALAAVSHPADTRAVTSFSRSEVVDETLDGGDLGGNLQPVAAVAVYAIGGVTHSPAVTELGSALVEAQVVNGILTQGIKVAVGRTRPDGGSDSFPSGHTSSTFATAGVLQRQFGWRVGIPAYAGGFYVAASRLAERRHYLSDVVFGAAIGIASSQTIAIHTRYGVISAYPALMKGGAELVFTVR